MPTTNDWLRQIYNVLSGGSSPGGGITQAQVQTAIESATNLNDIEPLLTAIQSGAITQAQVKAAIESATNLNDIEPLLTAIQSGAITQAQVKAAIESAVNLNDIEPLLTTLQPGSPRTLTLTSPEHSVNGTTHRWTVPAAKRWQFIAAYTGWVADATAANRSITLSLTSGGSTIFATGSTVYQTASQERYYSFGLVPTYAAFMGAETQRMLLTVPPAFLNTGGQIILSYPGRAAGDQFSPAIQVLEV